VGSHPFRELLDCMLILRIFCYFDDSGRKGISSNAARGHAQPNSPIHCLGHIVWLVPKYRDTNDGRFMVDCLQNQGEGSGSESNNSNTSINVDSREQKPSGVLKATS
jgi:hypothetical protein